MKKLIWKRNEDKSSESFRVFRGGSWFFVDVRNLRASSRGRNGPGNQDDDNLGFRCVQTEKAEEIIYDATKDDEERSIE